MAKYSQKVIQDYFKKADATGATKAVKGKALEDLAIYLFKKVPGIDKAVQNKKNTYETEEIDVALWNDQHPKGLKALNFLILVECKNWDSPVGSMEVCWFIHKIRSRSLDFGVLIAANGITGNAEDKKQAHDIVSKALADHIRVIIITRAEIESLNASDELVAMIKEKLCELTVSGTVWP